MYGQYLNQPNNYYGVHQNLSIFDKFVLQPQLPDNIQNIAIALLSIFIAVAIFLVERDGGVSELDRKVLLSKVIKANDFVIYIALLFLPPLFWDVFTYGFKVLSVFLFAYGAHGILEILYRVYRWLYNFRSDAKTERDDYRQQLKFEYLEEIQSPVVRRYEWQGIWNEWEKSNSIGFKDYLDKFIVNVNELINRKQFDVASNYVSDFVDSIKNLPFYGWHYFDQVSKQAFEWYKTTFVKKDSDKKETQSIVFEFSTENLIRALVKSCEENRTESLLIDNLNKHISAENVDDEYKGKLLDMVIQDLFELDSTKLADVVNDSFPPEWKVTLSNLNTKGNMTVWMIVNSYLRWAQNKILDTSKEFDSQLESLSYYLFPESDPSTWSTILTFIATPTFSGKRVESYIKSGKTFGFGSRVISTSGEYSKEELDTYVNETIKGQQERTIDLALRLFPQYFSMASLQNYTKEIASLGVLETSLDHRKNELVEIFDVMKAKLSKPKSNDQ